LTYTTALNHKPLPCIRNVSVCTHCFTELFGLYRWK